MMNDKISSEIVANCKLKVATSNNVCNNEFIGIHQFYGKVLICKHKWYDYIKWIELGRVDEVL